MYKDWENHLRYLVYRFFEIPTDTFDNLLVDSEYKKEEENALKDIYRERYEKLLEIIETSNLLSKRQKQVVLLYLGWCNDRFIGHRTLSEVARMMGIKQPVVFNYFKMAINKIKKYLEGEYHGRVKRKIRHSKRFC